MLTESQIEGYELAKTQEIMLNVAAKQMMILILLPTIKFDYCSTSGFSATNEDINTKVIILNNSLERQLWGVGVMVARWIPNPEVMGSIPLLLTCFFVPAKPGHETKSFYILPFCST